MLSPYERVLLALLGKEPDEVPLFIGAFAINGIPQLEKSPNRGYSGYDPKMDPKKRMELSVEFTVNFAKSFPQVCTSGSASTSLPLGSLLARKWGREVVYVESDRGGFSFTKPLLRDLREADRLEVPDLEKEPEMEERLHTLEHTLERDREAFSGLEGHLTSGLQGWSGSRVVEACIDQGLVEYNTFLMGMRLFPEKVHHMVEVMTEYVIQTLRLNQSVLGKISKLTLNDHSPTFMSRSQFEEFWLPYVTRVNRAFSGAIHIYHNEGEILRLVDLLPKAAFDAYEVGPETDIGKVKEIVGSQLCLIGNLDPVDLLPNGNPEDIEREVKRIIEKAAEGGRFILSTGGGPPRTAAPLRNWEAMIRACQAYGKYPV